jgi:hypothetical protein
VVPESDEWRSLGERLLALAAALEAASIPYAFGGAIAYNYYGEPRATRDIDINVFLPQSQSEQTLAVLRQTGVPLDIEQARQEILRTGQIRLRWEHMPVDLFFSTVPFHDESQGRTRRVPFRGRVIPVLSAEDITICKVAFNREQDWLDVRNVLAIQGAEFDLEYARQWLYDMFPQDDERVTRFERLVAQLREHGVL